MNKHEKKDPWWFWVIVAAVLIVGIGYGIAKEVQWWRATDRLAAPQEPPHAE